MLTAPGDPVSATAVAGASWRGGQERGHPVQRAGTELVVDPGAAAFAGDDPGFPQDTVDAISDLDLSYTPSLGSPWDAIQLGAQTWTTQSRLASSR